MSHELTDEQKASAREWFTALRIVKFYDAESRGCRVPRCDGDGDHILSMVDADGRMSISNVCDDHLDVVREVVSAVATEAERIVDRTGYVVKEES